VGRRRPRLSAEGDGGAKEQRGEDRKPKTGDPARRTCSTGGVSGWRICGFGEGVVIKRRDFDGIEVVEGIRGGFD